MNITKLVGAKLLGVFHDDHLYFKTDRGNFIMRAEGDCCAYAHVSDVTGVQAAVGGTIVSLRADCQSTEVLDGDCRDIHFYTFKTTSGHMDVILHVDHNGYYGGSLCDPEEIEGISSTARIPEV